MEPIHTIQGTSAEAELQSIKDDEIVFDEAATTCRDVQPAVGTSECTTSAQAPASQAAASQAVASQTVGRAGEPDSTTNTRGTSGNQTVGTSGSHQNEATPQRPRHSSQNQDHAHRESQAHTVRQSHPESQLPIITESPPPYPGPPLNQLHLIPPQPDQSLPSYNHAVRAFGSSVHNTGHGPVYILPPYMPLLPGQMPYSENVTGGQRSSQNVPVVTTRVVNRPHRVNATARMQVQRRNQVDPGSDYLALSFTMLVLCAFQGNIPALLCILPALACSMKARQYNDHENYRKAAPYGKLALWCNFFALLEYIILIVGIAAVLILLLVFNV